MTDDVIQVLGPLLADRTPGRIVRSARVPRDAGRDLGEKCGLNFQANSTASPARISSRYSRVSSDFPLPVHATFRRLHSQPYLSRARPFRLARRTMVRWRAGAWRASIALMQNEIRQTTTAATFGRSSIARLPPTLREAVDAAIADGATIDEITARIRADGGACSRSAVGRYVKNMRGLIRQQQEADRAIETWVRAFGERAQGRAGLILIETLRTLVLSSLADLSRREEPVSTEELARLALVLRRIEGTDKLRLERERAAAKAARAAPGAGQAPVRKGLSPEAVAAIREVVEGRPRRPARAVTSAPVDPWNPAESHLSQLIPLNPGESRSENVSDVSRPGPTPCLLPVFHPSTAGASSARLPTRHSARRAVARSGPAVRPASWRTPRQPPREGERETQTATACSPSPPLGAERAGERWGKSSSNDSDAEQLRSRPTSPCSPPP